MKKYFFVLIISLFILVSITVVWGIMTLVFLAMNGVQNVFEEKGFFENVASSAYMKWILLFDVGWVVSFIGYFYWKRNDGTETTKFFLKHNHFINPKICVIIPSYNEEPVIEQVVNDYINQKFVNNVIIIDNNSEDKTVELARKAGATVFTKNENRGFGHSIVMGLKKALETDSNIFVLSEADGTLSGNDLNKMLPYMEHCDIVRGSRQVQILNEKGNLREGILHIWGNYFLAKLIQLKYINSIHLGIVNMNDIGCMLRMFNREVIEKIEGELTNENTDEPKVGNALLLYIDMMCIENNSRIIEIPITFKKRSGESKFNAKITQSLSYAIEFLKLILTY